MGTRLAAVVCALGLVGAGCGGGGGDALVAPADAGPTEPAPSEAPIESKSPDAGEDAPPTGEPEPVELTASFRGVTEDTIRVGFTSIDFDRLNADFGLELNYASFTPPMERMVEALNDRGGIFGRRVELHVRPYLPVGANEAEAICIDLTQDVEVFAVLFGFGGPGAEDVNECFTVLNDTILVGVGGSSEQLARATAPWISNGMSRERRAQGLVDVLVANDRLAELGAVAIIASTSHDEPIVEVLRRAFADAGTEVVFDGTITTTGDQTATADEIDVFVEKARTEGVESFLFLGDDAYANEQLILSGDEFNLLWLDSGQVGHWRNDPPPGIEDTRLILATGPGPASSDDPEWADCVGLAEEAYGAEVKSSEERAEDETDYWSGMTNACLNLRLFELVATAAGPELTNDSFAAAVETFGDFTLPGAPFASLGNGKYDGSDTLRLTTWDVEEGEWTAISDPYDVTP